jgi:hypothetical protein
MASMASLQLKLDMTPVVFAPNAVLEAALGRLRGAVQMIAANTAAEWQTAVHKAKLWSGERDAYANSISWRMTGDLQAEVTADYRLAYQIEHGRPPYDLKQMLYTSLKTRSTKSGRRFLIIPFRHNTPGYTGHSTDMPVHVHQAAKSLTFSRVTGMTTRASGSGVMDIKTKQPLQVPQAKYFWGGRLGAGSMGPNPKGKVDRFAGMVRFEDTAGKGKPKSIYMTFRVMAEGSKGWVIAARPGQKLAEGVTQKMLPLAQQEFVAAIKGEV